MFSKVELKQAVKHGKITKEDMLAWRRSREFADFRYEIYANDRSSRGLPVRGFQPWFNTYTVNLERASRANEIVDQFWRDVVGWGRREYNISNLPQGYVELPRSGKKVKFSTSSRRLDIGQEVGSLKRGYEVKSGLARASAKVINQMAVDEYLIHVEEWDIIWRIDGTISLSLYDKLQKAGIPVQFRNPSADPTR